MTSTRAPTAVDRHVGKRLKHYRQVAGRSRGWLGKKIGVPAQQVEKYENAENRMPASRLYGASIALKVTVGSFFEGYKSEEEEE